jgi:hypothetical protein
MAGKVFCPEFIFPRTNATNALHENRAFAQRKWAQERPLPLNNLTFEIVSAGQAKA